MENKINISELLKDCPKGMELDCTICDNVYLDEVTPHMIKCFVKNDVYNTIYFHYDGTYLTNQNAKCVIFPKGKTTWEGFQRPFKDGDIIFEDRFQSICIFKKEGSIKGTIDYYCGTSFMTFHIKDEKNINEHFGDISDYRLATEEERQKLFDAIKANGYKWNSETKTLDKLIVPKFKVGDKVRYKGESTVITITGIKDNYYFIQFYNIRKNDYHTARVSFKDQDDWELVPNKFDISTLKAFESRVLVRDYNTHIWEPAFWGKLLDEENPNFRYLTTNGCFKYCIPYENNQHLLGTTNDCNEYYKTWE